MRLRIVGTKGDVPFEMSYDEIELLIKNHNSSNDMILEDCLLDEAGNIDGIRGRVDLGHGYGVNSGWKDFCVKIGEDYCFNQAYTSIEGPSDWHNDSLKITFRLVLSE